MFHYTHPYHADFLARPSLSIDPRDKYLAAVAEAKAAEAEYLAAQSTQREELALLRRLEEIQLQKQFQGRHFAPGLGDLTTPFDGYQGRHAHGYDHLASLRHQIEEEERIRRQLEEEKRLNAVVALRQAELERESRRREQEEHARLLLALQKEKSVAHLRERLARARQESHRAHSQEPQYFVHGTTSRRGGHQEQAEEVTLHPILQSILGKDVKVVQGPNHKKSTREFPGEVAFPAVLEQLFGGNLGEVTRPKARTQPVHEHPMAPESIQQALNLVFGGSHSVKQAHALRHQDAESFEKLLGLALGEETQKQAIKAPSATKPCSSRAAPATRHPEAQTLQQFMELLLGGEQKQGPQASASPPQGPAAAPSSCRPAFNAHHPHPEGLQQLLDLFAGGPQQKAPQASGSSKEAPRPSASQPAPQVHPEGLQQFLDLLSGGGQQQASASSSKAQVPQPSSSNAASQSHPTHPEGFAPFLDLFLGGNQQQGPQASSSSSKPHSTAAARPEFGGFEQFMSAFLGQPEKEQQSQTKPSTSATSEPSIPAATVESSLKAELESRLGNEYASEVRDTIQALLASLSESSAAPAATSAPAPAPAPAAGSSKGKEKAPQTTSAPSRSPENATSKDVIQSLDEVRNIEAAFSVFETEFNFPSQLDFISSHLTPDSPAHSDSEASVTSHLAYTSRNHPVRFYEQALGSLLSQLDSVDSFGNDELRVKRKQVVDRVEKALEELESEVEGRWRTRVAKELKSSRVAVTDPAVTSGALSESSVPQTNGLEAATQEVPLKTEGSAQTPAAEDASIAAPVVAVKTSAPVIDTPTAPEEDSSNSSDSPSTGSGPAAEASLSPMAEEKAKPSRGIPDTDANDANDTIDTSSSISLSESAATVRPTDMAALPIEQEPVDTFLLPAYPADSPKAKRLPSPEHDVDAGSDWSEIEA